MRTYEALRAEAAKYVIEAHPEIKNSVVYEALIAAYIQGNRNGYIDAMSRAVEMLDRGLTLTDFPKA